MRAEINSKEKAQHARKQRESGDDDDIFENGFHTKKIYVQKEANSRILSNFKKKYFSKHLKQIPQFDFASKNQVRLSNCQV